MRDHYFSIVGMFLVALTLLAFSDNLVTDIGQESNFDPKFVVHGIFCMAWMSIFAVQANLVRRFSLRQHQLLGFAAIVVAVGVVASTIHVFASLWQGWDKLVFYAKPNRIFLPSFAVLVTLGYLYRRTPDLHKRFMLMATLYMLEPVLSRLPLGLSPLVVTPAVWNALFISLFVYDWKTRRSIYAITYLGFIWFYIVWAIALLT